MKRWWPSPAALQVAFTSCACPCRPRDPADDPCGTRWFLKIQLPSKKPCFLNPSSAAPFVSICQVRNSTAFMILSEACLWSGGVWALLLVQPLSMVGMAPHNFQELVGTCWGPFEIWVHLGQGLHGLQLWQRLPA